PHRVCRQERVLYQEILAIPRFAAEEEECLIAAVVDLWDPHWPTERSRELVEAEVVRRTRAAGRPLLGVRDRISRVPQRHAVKLVRTRLCGYVDDAAAGLPVIGRLRRRLHRKLLHRLRSTVHD